MTRAIDEQIYREMEEYGSQGWTIIDNLVPDKMFDEIAAACRRVKAKVRAGEVDVYTHYGDPGEPWCIRGLIAPDFAEPVFADFLLHAPFIERARAYLGQDLRLGWIDLRTNTHNEDLPGGWHRDIGGKDLDAETELGIIRKPMKNLRWYLALIDDDCLQIVPRSQHRPRTAEERRVLNDAPHDDLAGQEIIGVKAGQVIFWDGNTVHRGNMNKDVERLTLAASWQKHSKDDPAVEKVDGRFEWRLKAEVRAALPAGLHVYYDRWRALQPA
ncbi:MAG: phytanoyl-CoA dioxygenase family protein [Candidatus Latescibacterota bacterium]|jgi:hypothetical protein|nr:phytanoyl-CoA dioxygenase family protein [Candidatus Latescibacterota bacterium]